MSVIRSHAGKARRWTRKRAATIAKRVRVMRVLGVRALTTLRREGAKGREELAFWELKRNDEGNLTNDWYRHYFTDNYGLDASFFHGKRMLDLGCGPRGSLEWMPDAALRVGLDPLAHHYRRFGTADHGMRYVTAAGERMPIANNSFDVISSFNSLDHVDNLHEVMGEITRVLAPGGTFLLLVDVNHEPTDSEPQKLTWGVVDGFAPPLDVVHTMRYERARYVYASVWSAVPYDEARGSERPGVLSAMFRKPIG